VLKQWILRSEARPTQDSAMEVIVTLLLTLFFMKSCKANPFHVPSLEGSFLTWQINNTDPYYLPLNKSSTEVKVVFKFLGREIGSVSPCRNAASPALCASQTALRLHFYFGSSSNSQPNFSNLVYVQYSCGSYSFASPTINGRSENTFVLEKDYYYKLKYWGCCWNPALQLYGSSALNQAIVISFITGKRTIFNSPVQLKYIPEITVAQHEKISLQLPFFDVDNDYVSCRWASNYDEGGGIYAARFGILLQSDCFLKINGSTLQPGKYPVAIVLEDYETSKKTVKFHSVSVQFIIEIKGPGFTANPHVNCSWTNSNPSKMPNLVPRQIPALPIPGYRPYTTTDACRNYKNLASMDRSITYEDWSNYRCDMSLFGWYRFINPAGIQMLNSCPQNSPGSLNSCGSYYKGWLKNQLLPSQQSGVVNRTVCFSKPYSCDCSYTREIKVTNCGSFYVYYLDAAPICNARYCGKNESGITVHCSSNYMQIDLDISRYNKSMYSSITLHTTSCQAMYMSTKISIGTRLGACGTTTKTVGDTIIYENQVILTAQHTGMISRRPDISLKVTCNLPSSGYAQSTGHSILNEVNATEPGFGQFDLYLNMFIGKNYAKKHDKYPVLVRTSDRLYFEVSTTASNQYTVLIDRCFSTPTEDSNHESKYIFIKERCNISSDVQFHKSSYGKQRFSAIASDLLANGTKTYLHCTVFLCHSSTKDSMCHSGCNGNNMKRVARSVDNTIFRPSTVSKLYYLQLGAIEKESGCSSLYWNSNIALLILSLWYIAT